MECFDAAGEAERGGNLAAARGKLRRKSPAEALHFKKVSAIVGIKRARLDAYAGDEFGRVGRSNQCAYALGTFRDDQLQLLGGSQPLAEGGDSNRGCHQAPTATATASAIAAAGV